MLTPYLPFQLTTFYPVSCVEPYDDLKDEDVRIEQVMCPDTRIINGSYHHLVGSFEFHGGGVVSICVFVQSSCRI